MKSLFFAAIVLGLFAFVGAETVNVELYYESMCPYCRGFITGSLNTAYNAQGLSKVMNLTMVPFGNAKESQDASGNFVYTCQHGAEECVGNLWAGCVIDQVMDVSKHFPVLECMEEAGNSFETVVPKCAAKFGVDSAGIVNCVNSQHGIDVQHINAEKTKALNPAHKYVPWIVINGQHTESMQGKAEDDLLSVVCDMLSDKPAGCSTLW
eukprot:TRINITY_DN2217_c0_g1_i1.p1 TRINITY_DN2217_c0_g1~~TRINITY_DN2217_c0_g1_i1.p1  ORF type:complete len:220 (-),score=67.64 TRINITY_DN2217_c0_g1_i1:54-680(-)